MGKDENRRIVQRRAYENRDAILPMDKLRIRCTGVTKYSGGEVIAEFYLPNDGPLWMKPPEGMEIKTGDVVTLMCIAQRVSANGYGLFVDYRFNVEGWSKTCIINGPDAQSLEKERRKA